MIQLTPDEARVFGVLIEKALTTPEQYPLSLNAVVSGANQRNNRQPVLAMTDDAAFSAVESLMGKKLAIRVDQMGARVPKFKHAGSETLHCRTAELAILAELMLRGPQTLGELRSRASRMAPFESLERVSDMIRALTDRPEPLVEQINPMPGSRAERYLQLIAPDAHPQTADTTDENSESDSIVAPPVSSAVPRGMEQRLASLEAELIAVKARLQRLEEGRENDE